MPLPMKRISIGLPQQQVILDPLLFNVDAEAWARGTRNGQDVTNGDPTFHNNAKYYAEKLPTFPTVAGNYVLNVTIINGNPSYSWQIVT